MTELKHKFVSGKAAAADPTLVDGPKWDEPHVFSGGSTNQVVTRDTAFDPPSGNGWKWSFVVEPMIAALAVTTSKIADLAVTTVKLADGAVTAPKIGDGQVFASKLRREETSGENSDIVTVTSAATTIVDVALSNAVAAGDRIFISFRAELQKGATGGETSVAVIKASGTATVEFYHDQPLMFRRITQSASEIWNVEGTAIAKVTGAGTLTMRLRATSVGSNSTVSAGAGQLYMWVMPGA